MTAEFAVVDSPSSITALAPEWDALARFDPSATPFQTAHVTLGLWRVFTPEREPLIVTARDAEGRLRAVIPLGRARRRIGPLVMRVLVPLPGWHASFFDAIVHPDGPPTTVGELLQFLREAAPWDLLECRSLRPESALRAAAGSIPMHIAVDAVAHRVELAPGEQFMSAGRRRELRRLFRQLTDTHTSTLEAVGDDPAARREALERFADLHIDRWRDTVTPSPFGDTSVRRRFVTWLSDPSNAACRLVVLRADGRIGGVVIVWRGARVDVAWRLAYDASLGRCSPGIQLLTKAMEEARAIGQSAFDLGRGNEEYKATWWTTPVDLSSIRWTGTTRRFRALRSLGRIVRRPWVTGWEPAAGGA